MSEISDVRTFVPVVERGGFAAASKDLGITASAVSKLIARLEDRLGVRLLHRTNPTTPMMAIRMNARSIGCITVPSRE